MIKVMFMVLAMLIPAMSCSMNERKNFVTYQTELYSLLTKQPLEEEDIKNAQNIIALMKRYYIDNQKDIILLFEQKVQEKQKQFDAQKLRQKIVPSPVIAAPEVASAIKKGFVAPSLPSSSTTIPQEPVQPSATKTPADSLPEDSSSKTTEQSWSILGWIKRLLPAINQQISSLVTVIRSHIARLWSLEKKETVSGAPENTALPTGKKDGTLSGLRPRKRLESLTRPTLPPRRTPNKSTKNLPSNDSLSTNASSWPK